MASKASQDSEVSIDPREKHIGNEVVLKFLGEMNISCVGCMVDDVDDEAQEAVGQILPSLGSFSQAIAKKFSI